MTVGGIRSSLWLLFGAVSVLLLITCTNIAALLLSRAAAPSAGDRGPLLARRVARGGGSPDADRNRCAGACRRRDGIAGRRRSLGRVALRRARICRGWTRSRSTARILLYTLASAVAVALLCGPASRDPRPPARTLAGALERGGPHAGVDAQFAAVAAGRRAGGALGHAAGRRRAARAQLPRALARRSRASSRAAC